MCDGAFVSKITPKKNVKVTTPPVTLNEFQETLRQRFPNPHIITRSEKNTRRRIPIALRSSRRLKPSSWDVIATKFSSQLSNLQMQNLNVETDKNENPFINPTSSQLALNLPPDIEKDTPLSSPASESHKKHCEQNNTLPDSPKFVKPLLPSEKSPLLDGNEEDANTSSEKGKTDCTYTELQKSIEGNLMGCEASLSDVELMDEIESSLHAEGDEDDLPCRDSPVFVDPMMTLPSKRNDFAEIKSQFLPVSTTNEVTVPDPLESPTKKSEPSQERRRSSRLAGVSVLPLKYRTEPLPDCRRISTKKKRPSSSNELNDTLSTPPKKLSSEPASDVPEQMQNTNETHAHTKPSPAIAQLSWQEIRSLLPSCWADILEDHVKTHHQGLSQIENVCLLY